MVTRTVDLGKVTRKTLVVEVSPDSIEPDQYYTDKTYEEILAAFLDGGAVIHWANYYPITEIGEDDNGTPGYYHFVTDGKTFIADYADSVCGWNDI